MIYQKERIDHAITRVLSHVRKNVGSVGAVQYVKSGYKVGNEFPKEGWLPFESDTRLQGKDSHFWLKAEFTTPAVSEGNYLILTAKSGREGQASIVNPQSILYLNGEVIQGLDTNHYEAYLEPETKYEMLDYFYTGNIADPLPRNYGIFEVDAAAEHLVFDMRVAYECCKLMSETDGNYLNMMAILYRAVDELDFREPLGENYKKSIEKAQGIITTELYEKLCSKEGKPVVNCIGHTHIDVEWLWTRAQTREKIQRSFATAAALMENYPEYKFILSQPELYRYLKEDAPEQFEKLKKLVKEGRWEPEGAMYLEADCNLSSGESLVRQILQGKKFFKDEFGIDSRVLFLPDVFGYSSALPQILKKSGVEHFVTSKISWNDTNTMPYDVFMWQGLDGSEIFTSFITAQDYKGEKAPRYTTYVGFLTPAQIKGTWHRFGQKEFANRAITTFGHGDGGGGPTKEMLENYRRLSKGLPGMPVAEMQPLTLHLDKLKAEFDEMCQKNKETPRWVGELYLEMHRGTYTSIARNKRANRKSEFMLAKSEILSVTDLLQGGDYDSKGLWDNWTKVLHNQFHDIIPGSSIAEVYEGTDVDYKEISDYCGKVLEENQNNIINNINTKGGIFVYNSLGFGAKGPVLLNGKTAEVCEEIPAFGWNVLQNVITETNVTVNNRTLENRYYIIEFDNVGRITRLYDKSACREVLKSGDFGNELQIFEDIPHIYDNWEIEAYYNRKMHILEDEAEFTPITDGSRAGFSIVKHYGNSVIKQNVWLYSDSRRIDFENDIDWAENHQLLKVAFPFDICAASATYEVQYGHYSRPTHKNTSWDSAKFEVCAHRFADVSDMGYGVSLLNDCKYGYSCEGSNLKLTLIKCGTYPNPQADQGKHIFTYSLLPHIGDFRTAGVINEGYILNQPLCACEIGAYEGAVPEKYSLFSCENNNVIIETVKKAEADDGIIIRMYDAFNMRTNAKINIPAGFKKAYVCDLMENIIEETKIVNDSVNVQVSNFEIVTLKFMR